MVATQTSVISGVAALVIAALFLTAAEAQSPVSAPGPLSSVGALEPSPSSPGPLPSVGALETPPSSWESPPAPGPLSSVGVFEPPLPASWASVPADVPSSFDCNPYLQNMSDCLSYVVAESKLSKPDKACCPELAGLVKSQRHCLRRLPGSPVSNGQELNLKRVLQLPSVCGVQVTADDSCSDEADGLAIMARNNTKKNNKGLMVGLAAGGSGLVLVGGLGLMLFAFRRKRMNNQGKGEEVGDLYVSEDSMDDEFEISIGPKKFSFKELALATNNFAEQDKLGEGGFGGVYRGFLKELNSYVAVKRVSRESKQGIKEYASEVKIISRLRHRNLVQLIGWCHGKRDELLLVYEFMENGSLDFHLFKHKSLLTWGVRYKIAQGLASALLYLHEEWEQCVVHRDIKPSNVMLDSDLNAKLGDFGLARFVDHKKGSQTTVLAGTLGYMAPECFNTGQASRESDVYSFGVVTLEIACGRKSIDPKAQPNQIRMVEWIWDLYGKGKLLEATDPKISVNFNEQEMMQLMIVGLWCAHPDSNFRPSIRQAIHVLNLEAPLPILPAKMPVPTYYAPSIKTLSFSQSLAYGGTSVSESSQAQSSSYSDNTDSSKFAASSNTSSPSALLVYAR